MCPETYVDALEEEFVAAIGEGLKGKDIPKRLAEVRADSSSQPTARRWA